MAVEVQRNKYWFEPQSDAPSYVLPSVTMNHVQQRVNLQEQQQFLHNYLHDIEGLFWIAAWVLFYTHPVSRPLDASDLPRAKKQLQAADRIFPSTLDGSNDRSEFLSHDPTFRMHASFLPEEYAPLTAVLSHVQFNLRKMYMSMEDPLENVFDNKLYGRVYDVLSPLFLLAKDCAQGDFIFLSDAIRKKEEKATKPKGPEKAVVTQNIPESDQVMGDEDGEGDGRDVLPAMRETRTASKRTREGQPEDSAAAKKRKIFNAESPSKGSKQTSLQGT